MKRGELVDFFGEFWEIAPAKISDDLGINDEDLTDFSSIRFYQFIAALESNFDVKIQDISSLNTFGDLCKLVGAHED